MTIPISRLVCGNCGLNINARCEIQGTEVAVFDLACFHIHKSFSDNGFESERLKPLGVNLGPILEEVKAIMEEERNLRRKWLGELRKKKKLKDHELIFLKHLEREVALHESRNHSTN